MLARYNREPRVSPRWTTRSITKLGGGDRPLLHLLRYGTLVFLFGRILIVLAIIENQESQTPSDRLRYDG